jgi:hypothetical protein
MASAQVWSGVAQGLDKASQYMSESDLRQAQLAEAKSRQQQSQMQLEEYAANAPNRQRANELEMQQLEANTRTINQQSTQQQTYDAFRRFESDKDVRHLNTWLNDVKRNPVGANLYGDVVRVDQLAKTTENDSLLRKMGYTDLDAVYNDPELSKDLVVMTGTDQRGIVNMNDMYAGTGFANYLSNEQLTEMERKARINQLLRSGQSGHKVTMQERVVQDLIDTGKASNVAEAYQLLKEMDASGKGQGVLSSTEERAVSRIMEDENISYIEALDKYYTTKRQGTGTTNESRFIQEYLDNNEGATYEEAAAEYRNLAKTTTQKEVADVQQLRTGLDEMNWLETNVGDMSMTERARVYRDYISPLEDLRNFSMSNEDKRTIRNLRDLTALGKKAGTELTPDETGLLDSSLNSVKKYIFDEVGGKKATSSYETFRNIFRNALYGASLTQAEINAFNKAAGTLGQQFQPVMAQLQVQMETIKENLEAVRDLNDPDIAHYYTGQSIEEIDNAIMAIEERMNDPRLRIGRKAKGQEIKVQRVQADATPTPQDVNGKDQDSTFDFDAAMKEAGL